VLAHQELQQWSSNSGGSIASTVGKTSTTSTAGKASHPEASTAPVPIAQTPLAEHAPIPSALPGPSRGL